MKRRVCESCLYFESADFSKNGWCHHPSRRQSSDMRLIVRANELGCRNGWNADLWVAATTDDGVAQRIQPHDSIGARARAEVEPAEQNDLITSIVAAKTENVALPEDRPIQPVQSRPPVQEDIFVNQTPSLTWSTGPISAQPASELVQDPKAAILRARDQFRQRRKTEGRLADRQVPPSAPLLASAREARIVDELDLAEPDPAPESVDPRYENRPLLRPSSPPSYDDRRPVSPVSLREIKREIPAMTEFPEDRVRFDSVPSFEPPIAADAPLEADLDDTWIETRQIDTVPPEPYEVDDLFEEDEVVTFAEVDTCEEEELSVRHRESVINRFFRQRRERRQQPPPPAYVEEVDDFVIPQQEQPQLAAEAPSAHVPEYRETRPQPFVEPEPEWQPLERPIARPARTEPEPIQYEDRSIDSYQASAWDRGESTAYQASSRPRVAPRREPEPVALDDDFVIPPPLPELEPRVRAEQIAAHRPRPRIQPTEPLRNPEPVRERVPEPPVLADEFGDQPLFAANPIPSDDYRVDPGSYSRPAPAVQAYRTERICQTCRDFRPSDNGERGWCNNKWAFNHRRMVDADDLACRNSLGSWWTPKDDVWRRDGDISRHAQQTPRVDQWLFGTNQDDEVRRRSGS